MELHLENKTVVVTGATKGIGKACVKAFIDEGCHVMTCARTKENIDAFNDTFSSKGAFAIEADVSSPADMDRLAKSAADRFGGIDVWVNNAGIYPKGNLEDMPLELWQKTFDINVNGVLYGTRAAIPYMRARGKGVVINAASYATIMPTAGRGAYGITKAAVSHITKVFGAELAPSNIRVVAYMPGFIVTELTSAVVDEYAADAIKRQVAQHRYGTPEEVAPLVVFLASDAASFITGSGVEISGGKYCVQNPYAAWENASKK